jgi:hypothetical protein
MLFVVVMLSLDEIAKKSSPSHPPPIIIVQQSTINDPASPLRGPTGRQPIDKGVNPWSQAMREIQPQRGGSPSMGATGSASAFRPLPFAVS